MTLKNPWRTLNSKEIYKNNWIRLREDSVIDPSGKNGIYGVIETHPAIGIVPLSDKLDTFLVGQYRYTLDVYSWEIPEGSADQNETTLKCAKRELLEETGLTASQWTFLDNIYTSNSITNEIGYIYLAEGLKQLDPQPESTEQLMIKKLPFKKAIEMVYNYEIKDALAIIGLMRVHEYLKSTKRY